MTKVSEINTGLGGNREVLKKKYYHLIILVKNQMGLKNLYLSLIHISSWARTPRLPCVTCAATLWIRLRP